MIGETPRPPRGRPMPSGDFYVADSLRANARRGLGFGTSPVFLASISTILGAVMFLRFGYAVGHAGLLGALAIILLGHLVTVPTSLAIAEIATNRRVEGGGEYFIISRSFGRTIGAVIGVPLFLSQAVSVAFYMIGFSLAFEDLAPSIQAALGLATWDPRMVSIPAGLLLLVLMTTRGADLGVKGLWVVVSILAVSLTAFFLGGPNPEAAGGLPSGLYQPVAGHDPFMLVFAIVFPAFTGMTAGVGLSGDLDNPRRSIPLGILSATMAGMLVYIAISFKLWSSATPAMLADVEGLVMEQVAVWGPIIPIGLAAATLSSAIGSIMVAPRTLQALAHDRSLPSRRLNFWLSRGVGPAHEPRNATLLTGGLALATIAVGNIDLVARLISMFFMVTYGSLCAISFLEHFAARPSYRPSFRTKWYLSLLGALMCLLLMFQMDPLFASLALLLMALLYRLIDAHQVRAGGRDDVGAIIQGVMTQATRYMQVRLQQSGKHGVEAEWRPSIIMVNGRTFDRSSPMQMLSWLCQRYGVGTYLHYMPGRLDREQFNESRHTLLKLIARSQAEKSAIFVETMISPSMRSALAQSLQIPGVSGIDHNTLLLEYSVHDDETVRRELRSGADLALAVGMNCLVLRHGDHHFGQRRRIHIWITWHDYANASLLILIAYILLDHSDWQAAEISVYAAFPRDEVEERAQTLRQMISEGRIPISPRNIEIISTDDRVDFNQLVRERSEDADLVLHGFTEARLERKGEELFERHAGLHDTLYVCARQHIEIE